MPELVACPSCGCKVQVGETLLGRRTRCIACEQTFVAGQGVPAPRLPDAPDPYPLQPVGREEPRPRPDADARGPARHRLPLCPRCHRPVGWDAEACPNCLHLLETEDADDPLTWRRRRDGEDHRGGLIDTLGTVSLLCAVLGLCTAGVGVLAALAVGVAAVVMAGNDLERMRRGELDPDGAAATQAGRTKGVVGIVLAVVFGAVVVLLGVDYFFALFL